LLQATNTSNRESENLWRASDCFKIRRVYSSARPSCIGRQSRNPALSREHLHSSEPPIKQQTKAGLKQKRCALSSIFYWLELAGILFNDWYTIKNHQPTRLTPQMPPLHFRTCNHEEKQTMSKKSHPVENFVLSNITVFVDKIFDSLTNFHLKKTKSEANSLQIKHNITFLVTTNPLSSTVSFFGSSL
jgi:hypothetical protein